jgi:uncharacterized membrane protein
MIESDILGYEGAGEKSADSVPQTIQEMVALEQREKVKMSASDRLADLITAFAGSLLFVALNAAWFAIWILINVTGLTDFDPFPFGLLTMIVSLEAIGLAIFVLISENRQAALADKRARLDLQVNLIAEREVTKLLEMVARIERRLGSADGSDPEVIEMKRPTHVRELADKMEVYEEAVDKEASEGPRSAADTQV